MNVHKYFLLLAALCIPCNAYAQETAVKALTLEEYVQLATQNDTEFQEILIDELTLQYRKDLNLPAKDLVLEAASQYNLFLSQHRDEPEGSVSLSKLFPLTGTEIEAEYTTAPGFTRTINSSDFTVAVTQPVAENAFGKATRLQDKVIGIEIDVIKHQIVEAYEDYLATVITAYFDWYEAYENLKIGESSYEENLKLMDNIKERQKSSIALPVDVNKIALQVLAKKETLIDLRERYSNALSFIEKAVRYKDGPKLIPQVAQKYSSVDLVFDRDFDAFKNDSRTYSILNLLETKSSLEVDKDANELLPSIDLLFGYQVSGSDFEIESEDNLLYAGLSMEWPFGNQVDRAEYETSVVNRKKTQLSTMSTHHRLYSNLKNLSRQIGREDKLLAIALEKIELARDVLKDETENYSFGKVTINDYIQAVNTLDNNRFDKVRHDVLKTKFVIEWLRITDRLISRNEINELR